MEVANSSLVIHFFPIKKKKKKKKKVESTYFIWIY